MTSACALLTCPFVACISASKSNIPDMMSVSDRPEASQGFRSAKNNSASLARFMLALRCPARARRAADKLCNIIKVEESDTVLHTGGSTEELNSVPSASMLAGPFSRRHACSRQSNLLC